LGKGKIKLSKSLSAATIGSAGTSRASSVVPEPHMPHATRAPTKMRTILTPGSDLENDVEMAPTEA
jgi:hypothetical protein